MENLYQPVDFGGQDVEPVGRYAARTFGWMGLGLMTTFVVMFGCFFSGVTIALFQIPAIPLILLIAELAVVIALSARVKKLSVGAARGLFFAYAVLNGVVFSTYLAMYDLLSLVFVFGMTALYFGVMAAVGYFTKVDLSGLRPVLVGGLVFLLVFWVVTGFMGIAQFDRILCIGGSALFLAFTAYDTQKIKAYHTAFSGAPEMLAKASIIAALELYLDFINLFLYILRLLGKRK